MTPEEWCNDVVGKPWVDRSYGPDSFDCWGLVIDSFKRIEGVELPDVKGYDDGKPTEEIGTKEAETWQDCRPEDGAVFCVVKLVKKNGEFKSVVTHVGRILQVGSRLMACHASGKDGKGQVIIEPLGAIERRNKGNLIFKKR